MFVAIYPVSVMIFKETARYILSAVLLRTALRFRINDTPALYSGAPALNLSSKTGYRKFSLCFLPNLHANLKLLLQT